MARALVPHGKVPFPRMGHVFWVPLLLTAVLVPMTRSQTVNIYRPHLTYQSQEGNLKFGVVCRIDWWSQQHNLDRATCSFKLQTLKASGIVDTDETRKLFVVERTSSSTCATRFWLDAAWRGKNLRLQCSWSYTTCAETRDNPQRQKNLPRTQECKNASKKAEITLNPENMRADFTRSAEIQTQMTRPQDGSQPRIDAALGMDLTLFCQVPNLRTLGDRVCEWLFWPQNNAANYSRLHISKRTLNNPSVVSLLGAELLSILSKSDDNNCNLGIRRTELKHQGNWSCDPGSGNDGWIIGSPEVELRLGPCSSDTECWQGGNRQLVCQISPQSRMRNAGAELKSCIRPCDSEKGQEVCQGLPNTVCEYDQSRHDLVRCGCKTPYVSVGTEFSNNNLMRCAKRCKADTECISNEICVFWNATTGSICLPTCEVHPCGQNATCKPHVPSEVFDQRCICNNGTYAFNNSGNHVEAEGCMAPRFGGLSMLAISADNGETQACNLTEKMETKSCTFNALEGGNITFVCLATQIFPEPQLQIIGNHNESLVHLEGAEKTYLRFEKGHQETPMNHGLYKEPNPVRDYKIEAQLLNAMKVRHDNAAFECHFKSEAHEAKVHVMLTAKEQKGRLASNSENFSKETVVWLGSVAGVSTSLLMLIALVAVLKKVYSRRRRDHRKSATQNVDAVAMHSIPAAEEGETRPADANATQMLTGMTFAQSPNEFLSDGGADNDEPIYEDVKYDGLVTKKNARTCGNDLIGTSTRTETRHHSGLGQENSATAIALGDGELSPNILPAKKCAPGAHFTDGMNLQPGIRVHRQEHISDAGINSRFIPMPTRSHAETQNHLRRPSANEANAPSVPGVEAEYAIVVA